MRVSAGRCTLRASEERRPYGADGLTANLPFSYAIGASSWSRAAGAYYFIEFIAVVRLRSKVRSSFYKPVVSREIAPAPLSSRDWLERTSGAVVKCSHLVSVVPSQPSRVATSNASDFRKRTTCSARGEKWHFALRRTLERHSHGSLCPKEVPNWRGKPAFSRRESQETRNISLRGGGSSQLRTSLAVPFPC